MKGIKAVAVALLLWLVTACGSDDDFPEQGKMDHYSQGDKDEVHVLTTFHCDEATKLRSGVTMEATNLAKDNITIRFVRTVTTADGEESRETIKEIKKLPPAGKENVDQLATPGIAYAVGVFKIESDGTENRIAYAPLPSPDPCRDGDD